MTDTLSDRLAKLRFYQQVHANIVWSRVAFDVLAVVDCSMGGTFVTNDADNVTAYLWAAVHLHQGDRLIYRDGVWDELVHRDGKFIGFRALCASNVKEALARLQLRVVT